MLRSLRGLSAAAAAALLALLAFAPAAANAAPDPSLGGQWHLDAIDSENNTPDSSGHGNTLFSFSDAPFTESGRFGNAVRFGSGRWMYAGASPSLEPDRLTVMAWVKRTGSPGSYKNVVAKGAQGCDSASWALETGVGGGLEFYVWHGGAGPPGGAEAWWGTKEAPPSFWDGKWHAVAGTYDGSRVKLYIDGALFDSAPAPDHIDYALPIRELNVGQYGGYASCGGDPSYDGSLDELRVYDRALNADEVRYLQTAKGSIPPDLRNHPTARFLKTAPSLKMKHAIRFSALGSKPGLRSKIVDFHWTIAGPGSGAGQFAHKLDTHCGVPTMAHAFKQPGTYRVTLTVKDAAGRTAQTASLLTIAKSEALPGLTSQDVFDCENPAKGNQPDRADCVKNFSFGIVAVNSRDPDECFKIEGRVDPAIFTRQGTFGSAIPPVASPLPKLYHAVVKGAVAINGIYLPLKGISTEYDSGEHSIGIVGLSELAVRIGPFTGRLPLAAAPFKLEYKKDIPLASLKVEPDKKGRFHVFDFDEAFDTPKFLGGLKTRGALSVDLLKQASETKVGVGLPPIFKFMGDKPALADAFLLSDNVNGLKLDGIRAFAPSLDIGPLSIENLLFTYRLSTNTWAGGAKVKLPGSPIALDASPPPPDWGFGLKGGKFDHAGFGIEFQPGFRPDLFPPFHTALLSYIGASLGVNPLRLTGKLGISVAEVVDETGVLFAAFASPNNTYDFPDDVGDELAPFAGRTLDAFTLAIGGTAALHVPILGYEVPLLNAYGMYQYPDYFELGGGFKFDKVPFLDISGGVSGFVYPSQRLFNFEGNIHGCLKGISVKIAFIRKTINPCLDVGGVVSSTGIGFCGVVVVPIGPGIPVVVGLGYKWGDTLPSPKIFSCDYNDYKVASPKAARAAASGYSIVLPRGLPSAMFRVRGSGGAPDVKITDPRGRDVTDSNDLAFMQWGDPNTVFVAVRHPIGGRWTVSPKSGSSPIASVASAQGMPKLGVKGNVTGHGRRRVLHYRLTAALAGRKVVFAERGPRTNRVLGKAHDGSGTIRFKPGTGRGGRRVIVALVSQNGGAPAKALRVTTYKAPPPERLGRPPGVKVKRVKRGIRVSWKRVAHAVRYEVLVTLSDRSEVFRVTRATHIRLPDPFPLRSGKVLVAAIASDGSRGSTAKAKIRAKRLKKPKRHR